MNALYFFPSCYDIIKNLNELCNKDFWSCTGDGVNVFRYTNIFDHESSLLYFIVSTHARNFETGV